MTFTAIGSTQTDANSPVNVALMDLIRTNLDDLDSRITTFTSSVNYISAVDSLVERNILRRSGTLLHEIDNTVSEVFNATQPGHTATLIENYTSGTTNIKMVINPTYVNDSDKNFDTASGWSAAGTGTTGATSVAADTTAGTFKVGSASLKFIKGTGGTTYGCSYALAKNIQNNLNMYFWWKQDTITNFSAIQVQVHKVNDTDYKTIDITTDYSGSSITAATMQVIKADLSLTGTATGAGWATTDTVSKIVILVKTSTTGQVVTVNFDSVRFGDSTGGLITNGEEFTIYNTSTNDNLIVDSASTYIQGSATLAASASNAYTSGTATVITRSVVAFDVTNLNGIKTTGLSGEAASKQEIRIKRKLDSALTSVELGAYVAIKNDTLLTVSSIPDGTTIKLTSQIDTHLEYLSGDVLRVVQPLTYNGKTHYKMRSQTPTLTGNGTWSSSILTLAVDSSSGVAVGDLICVKTFIRAYSSLVTTGANESYSEMTSDSVVLMGSSTSTGVTGLAYYYHMGDGTTAGTVVADSFDTKPMAVAAGTLTSVTGKLTLATSGFGTGYIQDSRSVSDVANTHFGGTWQRDFTCTFWWYNSTFGTSSSSSVIGGHVTGVAGGWSISQTGSQSMRLESGTSSTTSNTNRQSLNTWSFHAITHSWSGSASTWNWYMDNSLILTNSTFANVSNMTSSNKDGWFTVGADGAGANNAEAGMKFEEVALYSSVLTTTDLTNIYNGGTGRVLVQPTSNVMLYKFSKTGQTGQDLSYRVELAQRVDASVVQMKGIGITRK